MPVDAPEAAGTAQCPAELELLRMAVQQAGGGVGGYDISGGLEPVPLPVDRQVEEQALLRLRQTLHRVRCPCPLLRYLRYRSCSG